MTTLYDDLYNDFCDSNDDCQNMTRELYELKKECIELKKEIEETKKYIQELLLKLLNK